MTKKQPRPSGSGSDAPSPDLRSERDQFLEKLTRRSGAHELLEAFKGLEEQVRALEAENADLRTRLEAESSVRQLLQKIEQLEREKSELLSRFERAEALSSKVSARIQEVEAEFSNLASLFVASNQLHSSLSPRGVARRIKDVLAQMVGAERYCMYLANAASTELVPIASEGILGQELVPLRVEGTGIGEVFRSGAVRLLEGADPRQGSLAAPAAIVPLNVDDRVVGVIAIVSTLSQKDRFDQVDIELFQLLGKQAAAALVGASLFAQAERKLPGLEAFLDLSV